MRQATARARRCLVALAFGLTFALAACGNAATPGPTAEPPGSPAPATGGVATEAPTQAPPATQAVPPEPCTPAPECQLPAGTYHAAGLDGGMTFRIHGDVWTNVVYQPEMLSLHIGDEWVVFMSGEVNVRTRNGSRLTTDPAVFEASLAKLPGIEVATPAGTAQIDGTDASMLEVSNTGEAPASLWSMGLTSARYGLNPGSSVRVYWLDRDGVPFVLALEAPTIRLPILVEDAQVVIDSIAFD